MSLAEFRSDKYRNNANSPWSSEALVNRLVELWDAGTSSNHCRNILNREFPHAKLSRNAVIGRVHRMGLKPHPKSGGRPVNIDPIRMAERRAQKLLKGREWAAKNKERIAGYASKYYEKLKLRRHAPTIEDYSIPTPQRKTIYELGDHDCRWPVGEPKSELFFFCGAVAEDNRPYCSSHCQRAYAEIRPR